MSLSEVRQNVTGSEVTLDAKRVNRCAVLPQIPTWINQKGSQSADSFPATRPVYGTVATDAPSRKGSQIRKL